MKKRILLVLAFGISFSPMALAAPTGQLKMKETAMRGVRCGEFQDKPSFASPTVKSKKATADSAN